MKNYKLERQFKLINFIQKQIYKVSPNKVNNPSSLTIDEEEKVTELIKHKYNLSIEQIHSYIDNNGKWGFNSKDLLSFFLSIEGDLNNYDFYITKQNAMESLFSYLSAFLFTLIPTIAFYVVCAIAVRNLIGYIVMGTLGLIVFPIILYLLIKFLQIYNFISNKNECETIKVFNSNVLKTKYSWALVVRYSKIYVLHYLTLICDIEGKRKKYIYYPTGFCCFPRNHYFSFVNIINSLNKAFKSKSFVFEVIKGTNVILVFNKSIEHTLRTVSEELKG